MHRRIALAVAATLIAAPLAALPTTSQADEADTAWIGSSRADAEEAYGDYQLVVDAIADRLLDLRDGYAGTLAEDKAEAYRRTFAAKVKRRFGRYASLVSDLESD